MYSHASLIKEDQVAVHYVSSPSAMNGLAFMKKMGVEDGLLAALQAKGWSVKLTAKKISIEKGSVQLTKEMHLDTLQQAAVNAVPADVVAELKTALTEQAKLALTTPVKTDGGFDLPFSEMKPPVKKLKPKAPSSGETPPSELELVPDQEADEAAARGEGAGDGNGGQ